MSYFSFKNVLLASAAAVIGITSCKPVEELSQEAKITSFTFDTSIEANSIVTSQPVIEGNNISFTVSHDATSEQLSALVPTITVSENATVSPASGSAVDFSKGAVTFTVTAEDGETTASYTATATKGQPSYPIDEQHVTVDGGFFGNTIIFTISIDFNGTPVEVTFNGTKLTGN